MSADNAIFIVDHPRGYAVFEYGMSGMPHCLVNILQRKTAPFSELYVFKGKDALAQAHAKARGMQAEIIRLDLVLEYGICDLTNPDRKYFSELHEGEW